MAHTWGHTWGGDTHGDGDTHGGDTHGDTAHCSGGKLAWGAIRADSELSIDLWSISLSIDHFCADTYTVVAKYVFRSAKISFSQELLL